MTNASANYELALAHSIDFLKHLHRFLEASRDCDHASGTWELHLEVHVVQNYHELG
jgi:hypothetical protein